MNTKQKKQHPTEHWYENVNYLGVVSYVSAYAGTNDKRTVPFISCPLLPGYVITSTAHWLYAEASREMGTEIVVANK